MLSIARRTAAGAAVLLVIPTVVWFSGWMWQPGQNETWLKALYWITETVTQPWGLLRTCCSVAGSCGACAFAFARRWYCCHSRRGHTYRAGEVVGQRSRAGTPSFRRLAGKTHHVPVDEFYNLKRKDRGALVKEQLAEQQDIPTFYANTGKRDRLCVSFRAYDVCCQLGATWRRTAVAASAYPHDCDFAGLGDRRNGQPDATGDALAA